MKFDKDKDLESLIQDEAWLWSRLSIKISMFVIALLTISGVGFLFSPTLFVEKNELSNDELDSLLSANVSHLSIAQNMKAIPKKESLFP